MTPPSELGRIEREAREIRVSILDVSGDRVAARRERDRMLARVVGPPEPERSRERGKGRDGPGLG